MQTLSKEELIDMQKSGDCEPLSHFRSVYAKYFGTGTKMTDDQLYAYLGQQDDAYIDEELANDMAKFEKSIGLVDA